MINGIYAYEKAHPTKLKGKKKCTQSRNLTVMYLQKKSNESVTRSTIPHPPRPILQFFKKKQQQKTKKNKNKTRTICEETEMQI